MAFIYFAGALAVIFYNIENIWPSFLSIFQYVFSQTAATGGFLGASIAFALNKGVGRGLFSNEAGQGSAPIAHASAKGKEPVSEGLVAILEPFIGYNYYLYLDRIGFTFIRCLEREASK